MRIDLALYKACIPRVRSLIKNYEHKSTQSQLANRISEATGMPVIVACYFVAGVMNRKDKELLDTIDNLVKFYQYTGVDNEDKIEY